jgi:hypothetical protein
MLAADLPLYTIHGSRWIWNPPPKARDCKSRASSYTLLLAAAAAAVFAVRGNSPLPREQPTARMEDL